MLLFLLDAREAIGEFFTAGGPILRLIALLTFVMWVMILERFAYYTRPFHQDLRQALAVWSGRRDHYSWYGDAVRRQLVSELRAKVNQHLRLIKVMIALCPLFGLLGTVTGMIDVFSILAITGGGDARSMAGGVSRATIPTMAGMVAALSGVFGNIYLSRLATQRREHIDALLPIHHLDAAPEEGTAHGT
ncbi:MotA/TolQ/ExbB proton channel family protein [Flagellatimonas centrodinii]|uniref:MotA/TolQ/ExbB proton channel family protein n=1 Tax=Flagellatimonas centrodinii TaxID=2806210 RepID=UPI001FEFC25D|nr:MotA/TolQ/ExbB proton channel family protein [Flagellatimonas centrodinii]ULQ45797.1 MotA/TolQ/ExbB proton channel family protein [Flagellatimonas centrodinii]